ncbi:DUF3667 domain-containing protein [Roseateles amylovorans]|uniref:DUF3667 domain-containing protein n=1 Tax=Roseateles amylovorans TaxID=2978473 RepID=A0ABY6AZJ2_9BURK|nr:DUF3667 domain-containing protein [Roseateles amylovorans]UXH78000.1 DUF3667 domain-containing protein [Roseateles amylovorans]
MTHPSNPTACPNCHVALPSTARFCPGCGQETPLHPASMREFIHEFVGHYVALEGPLWRSLAALAFLPGRLTREYFLGRRRRYVQPLRLYLSLSFVFFITLHLVGDAEFRINFKQPVTVQHAPCATEGDTGPDVGRSCGWFERKMMDVGKRLVTAKPEEIQARIDRYSPYALLLMQPAFAALLALVFFRRHLKYAEHFVFALHLHAFWFLAFLASLAASWLAYLIAPWALVYGVAALRRVYGVSWWGGIWRSTVLSALYLPLISVGVAALVVLTSLSAG